MVIKDGKVTLYTMIDEDHHTGAFMPLDECEGMKDEPAAGVLQEDRLVITGIFLGEEYTEVYTLSRDGDLLTMTPENGGADDAMTLMRIDEALEDVKNEKGAWKLTSALKEAAWTTEDGGYSLIPEDPVYDQWSYTLQMGEGSKKAIKVEEAYSTGHLILSFDEGQDHWFTYRFDEESLTINGLDQITADDSGAAVKLPASLTFRAAADE